MPTSFVSFLESQKELIGNNIKKNTQIDLNIFNDLPLYSGIKPFVDNFDAADQANELVAWWEFVLARVLADLFDEEENIRESVNQFFLERVQYEQKDAGIKIELGDLEQQKNILLDAYVAYILRMLTANYTNNERCKQALIESEKNIIHEAKERQFPMARQKKTEAIADKPIEKEELRNRKNTPKKSGANKNSARKNTPIKHSPRKKMPLTQIKEYSPEQIPPQQIEDQLLHPVQVRREGEQQPCLASPSRQQRRKEQQQRIQQKHQQPILDEVDEACKKYQQHLLREIERHYPRSGHALHYAVTSQATHLPYKISFVDDYGKNMAGQDIKIAIKKYNLVADMRAKLHQENISVHSCLQDFSRKLNKPNNLQLLNTNRDSWLMQFLKLIHCAFAAVTRREYGGRAHFWKPHGQVFVEHVKANVLPVASRPESM